MLSALKSWRTVLALVAICIVSGTIWYSSYIAKKIATEERQKVEEWVEATNSLLNPNNSGDTRLLLKIFQHNDNIPIIATNENDSIMAFQGLDSARVQQNPGYLKEKLREFKASNPPIEWVAPLDATHINRYYYGHTPLLTEVRYYPLVQLFIVGLFIFITVTALRSSYRATQNQVWAGMAKETAHQLGTPVSSLEGWVEILKETHGHENFVGEIEKDVSRLRLVSDRFGKIGSTPKMEPHNIVQQVSSVMEYVKKRAGGRVVFNLNAQGAHNISAPISAPLFDWVIENLLKNALDAMEGEGSISVSIKDLPKNVLIDVKDTGKGIAKQNIDKVFKPGFTTKKRGWGLGLSLSKRIIEQYHSGSLTVKSSEPQKGTTFRIVLIK